MIDPGHILGAWSDTSDDSVADARAYIRREGLTADDVRLIKNDGMVLVIAKRMPVRWSAS